MTPAESMRLFLAKHNGGLILAYSALPSLLREHHGIEQTVLAGGYGYRQILELVQNGADAILEASEQNGLVPDKNRIHVLLRGSKLYVANTGAAVSTEGVEALLSSHSSPKRGNQIGRFGLGFKSLLALEGKIDLFSRSGSAIRFDQDRCRKELSTTFGIRQAPGLRLAWPIDDLGEEEDSELTKLLLWAETIVRIEIGAAEALEHLRREILSFPAEFLLFFPVETELFLDCGEIKPRTLNVERHGASLILHDGNTESQWRVARRDVQITDTRAIADATHIHARDTVPLVWAMPIDGKREEAGRFWAFFPTQTPTYVRGILNAPWKLNSDRNAIISGTWNTSLMKEAAQLIADTLPELWTADDPARPLDAFPRQLERRDDDAAPLVEALWRAIETAAVVPDTSGKLKPARLLLRHPRESSELAIQWKALAGPNAAAQLVHPGCLDRLRMSRLGTLADRLEASRGETKEPRLRRCDGESWFAAVASPDVERSMAVLRLAEAYSADCKPLEWEELRGSLPIIADTNQTLVKPPMAMIGPVDANVPGFIMVSLALQANTESRRILSLVMKVRALDDAVWAGLLAARLRTVSLEKSVGGLDSAWSALWVLLRQTPLSARDKFLALHRNEMRVRRSDNNWTRPDETLIPGCIVAVDDASDNRKMLIDPEFHTPDEVNLRHLGVTETPSGDLGPFFFHEIAGATSCLIEWRSRCRDLYKETYANPASRDYLGPALKISMPRGFELLGKLSCSANAKLTRIYLDRIQRGEFRSKIEFGHATNVRYETLKVSNPLLWLLLRHGVLLVNGATVSLSAIASVVKSDVLTCLPQWRENYAALVGSMSDILPPITPAATEMRALWIALFQSVTNATEAEAATRGGLWSQAARDGVVPASLPSRAGRLPINQVFVTSSLDLARRGGRGARPIFVLDEDTMLAWVQMGARKLSDSIRPAWVGVRGPTVMLPVLAPELSAVLRKDEPVVARGQAVEALQLCLEDDAAAVPCLMWEGTLLLDLEQLARLPRSERLRAMINEAAAAGWLSCLPDAALTQLGDAEVDELRKAVARLEPLAARLLHSVGGRREPLLAVLGELGNMKLVQACEPLRLAELILAQFGPTALVLLKDALTSEGLKPPTRWNSAEARAFVASIGFPEAFAVSPESRREAEEFVSGPIDLPPLHDFQEEVLGGISQLLGTSTGRRRAVVSLPTGGGKTRVSVEAAVRLVLTPDGNRRSVIWVAQTDELCEQAVQAFRQVWINLGAGRTDLRVIRLWGGNPNPAAPDAGKPVVVVASIQTLNYRLGGRDLAWLQQPGLVIVDECHHAITPSYSNFLRWLDAEMPRPGAPARDEPPIIGLSATPFRTDDEESRRLAKRFDSRWFPNDQEALHARLQSQGVLARADYQALNSGSRLLDSEIGQLERLPETWEGLDFDRVLEAINQRLGSDADRSERLVQFIRNSSARAILFFANSVAHAQEMAARLTLASIPAAAVSGATATSARRHFLNGFQSGDVRVLCNHSVLTTGFDAPRTDMVLIARQVFSPVRYMQMVGRGLRGERNGGTAYCKIVTVLDNLGRFENRHPFHYCRQHFSMDAGRPTGRLAT